MQFNLAPITEVFIGNYFSCSSSEVFNSLFDDICGRINKKVGLKSLIIDGFEE